MTYVAQRPIVDGREQMFRFELRRVDELRRRFVFVHDLYRYDEAVLYADVAVTMLGGAFVIWDNRDRRVLYDTRTTDQKRRAATPKE